MPPTPPPPRGPSPGRAAASLILLGTGATSAAVLLLAWAVTQVGSTQVWRVEAVVGPAVVVSGALAAAWLGVSALLAAVCAVARTAGRAWQAGEAVIHRWAPGLVRRVLTVAVAAAVGLGSAVGAQGAGSPADSPVVTVDLGWSPTATGGHLVADVPPSGPTDTAPPSPTTTGPPSSAALREVAAPVAAPVTEEDPQAAVTPAPREEVVVVRAGDTLWGIAARTLGPHASDAAVADEWPRWYAANAATIGPDPDVLQPGQILTVPTPGSPR
ncbi:LysM peptidoglycan-binding domain-containing protein [Cellulomonas sp. zg-ZUI222]|uniref:LysM peptidoglycan-binding domain-containing protein n=1 Tax=Cellulomonas TaxID=1707 RepID=UPI001A953036|nr:MULTISPECIES: LysM domain-containing protein [Cellulomonas]MBO0899898.1 LysM peptidoglycan-binding domain-containing protein [Cellulomonas sp. zg-ZUI22]MBO0921188.1 LysM peptidoglycan-binding domain-containing protein [Cellulomonas wangleii]